MKVQVLFFGIIKDFIGREREILDLPDGAELREVLEHYATEIPKVREIAPSLAISLNREYASGAVALKDGDEVALLPPVSGGLEDDERAWAIITTEKIDTNALLERIKRPEHGAVVVFEGIVRNQTRGRRTLYLDYEAYKEMAAQKMNSLAHEALARFDVQDVLLQHRLGRLEIGETSVCIVVAAGHRAAAFEANRWLIDTLKKTVPIWKKEHFEDGAIWADGEPFPVEFKSDGQF